MKIESGDAPANEGHAEADRYPMTLHFSEEDQRCLQQLKLDPSSEPSFELLKSCLVWADERPERISNDGYELLCDLWIVRGYIHRRIPAEEWKLDPAYFQSVWCNAQVDVPEWPGFKRLVIMAADREYLETNLRAANEAVPTGEGY